MTLLRLNRRGVTLLRCGARLAFFIGLGINGGVTYQVRNRPVPPPSDGSTDSAQISAVKS